MRHLIQSVDLKIARASDQIAGLSNAISEWASHNPIKTKCELRENRLGFRLIIEEFDKSAPLENFGVLVGECIHNLRSSLDNLAFALARLHCDPPVKPKDISFPIFEDEADFKSSKSYKGLSQLPVNVSMLIERLQPFQRNHPDVQGQPKDDPLVLLQNINNSDKHRIPTVTLLAPKEMAFSQSVEFHSEQDAAENVPPNVTCWGRTLKPGIVLIEHKTNKPIKSVSGQSDYQAVVALQINDNLEPVDVMLRHLHWYTNLVTDQFRGFFT